MKKIMALSLALMFGLFMSCSDILDIEDNVIVKDKDSVGLEENPIEDYDMSAVIVVQNSNGDMQELKFGFHPDATFGSEYDEIGKLDADLNEVELGPLQSPDKFDARWAIQGTNGIRANFFPIVNDNKTQFTMSIQPGFGQGTLYTYDVFWNTLDIPDTDDKEKNPQGWSFKIVDGLSFGQLCTMDMKTGEMVGSSSYIQRIEKGNNLVGLRFHNDVVTTLHIICE